MNRILITITLAIATHYAAAQVAQPPAPAASPTGIALSKDWDSPMQGGSETLKDLGIVLSRFAKPSSTNAPEPSLTLYPGVTYLMPFEQARQALSLRGALSAKTKLACPGFPKDSFFFVAFDGAFDGHYNRLYLVLDRTDQVVCLQLVDETPKKTDNFSTSYTGDYRTYNFVNYRNRATPKLKISHRVFYNTSRTGGWSEIYRDGWVSSDQAKTRLFRIDSLLVDPDGTVTRNRGYTSHTSKPLEEVRWYIPLPLAELILQCINRAGAKGG